MSMNEVFSQAIATAILAVAAAIGAKANAALTKRKQRVKDLACAEEKITQILTHLGLKKSTKLQTLDDVFKEIRHINAYISFPAKAPIVDTYSPEVNISEYAYSDERELDYP